MTQRHNLAEIEQLRLEKASGRKRWLLTAAKGGVSIALAALIVSRVEMSDVLGTILAVDLTFLLGAFSLLFVGIFLAAKRWKGLLAAQGLNIPLAFLMQSWMVGHFFKQFLPSTIGTDVVRVYDTWRAGANKSVALAVVGVDRLFGLLTLALFAVVALAFTRELVEIIPMIYTWVALAAIGLSLVIWWIFIPPKRLLKIVKSPIRFLPRGLQWMLEKMGQAVAAFRGRRLALAAALGISIVFQLNVVTFYFLIGRSMGFEIPYHNFLLIVPLAIFIMLVPVSINAIGIREGAFVFLLAAFGISGAQAVAYAWVEFGLFLSFGLLGGIVYALRR